MPKKKPKTKRRSSTPTWTTAWTVPVNDDHAFKLELADYGVFVSRPVASSVNGKQCATIAVAAMTPLEACQLGQALIEASRVAGAAVAKRRAAAERSQAIANKKLRTVTPMV